MTRHLSTEQLSPYVDGEIRPMTRHLSTEQLSSYMDGEIGLSQIERIEEHLGSCPACRGRLESMEQLVLSLHRIERPALPPALAAGVRRQIDATPAPRGLRQRLWLLLSEMSLRPAFRTSAAMGLAMIFSVFLLSHGLVGSTHREEEVIAEVEPIGIVKTYLGTPPLDLPQDTTSEVAGREFVWSETGNRWIQRGLEGKVPESHVAAKSPEGRAMLSKYSDLEYLLEGGTPVVMRYRLATVELSGS
jgi:hypothetical protein